MSRRASARRACGPRRGGLRRGRGRRRRSRSSAPRRRRRSTRPARRPSRRTPPPRSSRVLRERARALEAEDIRALSATAVRQPARPRPAQREAGASSLRSSASASSPTSSRRRTTGPRPAVTMSYRVRGMSRPFYTERKLVARKEPAGWRVTRDVARHEPLPWDVASFKATRVPHVVLLTPPGVDAAPLRDGLADALPRDPPQPAGARPAAQRARDRRARPGAGGAPDRPDRPRRAWRSRTSRSSSARRRRSRSERVFAQRMIVIDSRWRTLPAAERQATLVHEMTHTALDPDTSGRTPPWLAEGVAMYVSADDRVRGGAAARRGRGAEREAARAVQAEVDLPPHGEEQGAAYAASSGAAYAIVDAARHQGPVPALRRVQRLDDQRRGRASRRPIACCGARWTCRSPSSRRPSPGADARRPPGAARCQAEGMPELPEVETIRRHLAPHVEGRVLAELDVLDARWCEPVAGEEVAAAVEGRRVEALARRGKYLVWELEDDVHLMLHLRMTGTLLLDPPEPPRYARVRFGFDDGRTLYFDDPRRFGTGELALGGDARDEFFAARLGVEPLSPDFTSAHLYALTRVSRAPIKAFLLDQRKVAGVGNIYADEALFRARHPPAAAGREAHAQAGRGAARRRGRVARGGAGREGRVDRRLPPSRRRPGLLPGPLPDPPARGRAVPRVRAAGAQAARGGTGDVRLRALPAAAAAGRSGGYAQVGQPAGAVGGRELLKAPERLAVEDHLREGHHAGARRPARSARRRPWRG